MNHPVVTVQVSLIDIEWCPSVHLDGLSSVVVPVRVISYGEYLEEIH